MSTDRHKLAPSKRSSATAGKGTMVSARPPIIATAVPMPPTPLLGEGALTTTPGVQWTWSRAPPAQAVDVGQHFGDGVEQLRRDLAPLGHELVNETAQGRLGD